MDSPGSAVSTWGLQTSPVCCSIPNACPWLVNPELQATVSIVQAAVGFLAGCPPPEQSLCPWCPPGHSSQALAKRYLLFRAGIPRGEG